MFNLEKEVEKAKFVIAKRNISTNLRASVVMDIDVSGSAEGLFRTGQIQEAFQRVLPIGITFDDNQEIDVFTFASGDSYTTHIDPNATAGNYGDYIKKNILDNRSVPKWGGTTYAPVIRENLESLGFYKEVKGGLFSRATKKLQQKNDSGTPAIIYFFTDGANSDESATSQILRECQEAKTEVYFLFIGIGGARFPYIERIGDEFDNVGFLDVADLNSIKNDDGFYEKLLPEELAVWLKDYV